MLVDHLSIVTFQKLQEDVRIMKDMGMDAYRLSIAWSRILPSNPVVQTQTCYARLSFTYSKLPNLMPDGSLSGGINREGIRYYNSLINELLLKGMHILMPINYLMSPFQ